MDNENFETILKGIIEDIDMRFGYRNSTWEKGSSWILFPKGTPVLGHCEIKKFGDEVEMYWTTPSSHPTSANIQSPKVKKITERPLRASEPDIIKAELAYYLDAYVRN